MEHINRRGDCYFVYRGKTKTGKPKYFASKRATSEKGVKVDSLPDEFEIFENPSNCVVTIRRHKPSQVSLAERELVDRLAIELSAYTYVQTIIDGDRIVIYTPDGDIDRFASELELIFGPMSQTKIVDRIRCSGAYTAELRFTLLDADNRTYTAERYCFRGSVDDWIWIDGPDQLDVLANKILPLLGKDSFYDFL